MTKLLLSLTALAVLAGCGKDLCVAGIGECKVKEPNPITGKLEMTAPVSKLAMTSRTTLTIKGGQAPYTVMIMSGGGSLAADTATTVIFQAPNFPGAVVIKATDETKAVSQVALIVE